MTDRRARVSGHSILSQGEPMIWLTGGMFAVACSMILALLVFILYQGLATHWQRPYVIYALNNGELIGGELQNRQAYRISRQSIDELDPISVEKANQLLLQSEQADSSQLYLRTGNYDVTGKHFAFVPSVTLSNDSPMIPESIWLLERREWGILYGFPTRLVADYSADYDAEYRMMQTLLTQLADMQPIDAPELSTESLKSKMQAWLDEQSQKLKSREEDRKLSNSNRDEIWAVTQAAIANASALNDELERAKHRLGRVDQLQAASRLAVRAAELADKTELQATADLAIENATAMATIMANGEERSRAIDAWASQLSSDAETAKQWAELKQASEARVQQDVQPVREAIDALRESFASLPPRSKQAIESVIQSALDATKLQLSINNEMARLEDVRKSRKLILQLPLLEAVGPVELDWQRMATASDDVPVELKQALWADEANAALHDAQWNSRPIRMSDRQMLVALTNAGNTPRYVWLSRDGDASQVTLSKLAEKEVFVSDIVRAVAPNQLSTFGKLQLYAERWGEFLFGQPREAGIEGGFFPAIWGTIVMTLIMSIAVMPFGVMAALYMREYAKAGWILSLIRISINNLAGVPSIVYGVFGLAFFCYAIGGYIDGGPVKAGFTPWPPSTWFVALAVTAVLGTSAFLFAALGSGSPAQMSPLRKRIAAFSGLFWFACLIGIVFMMAKSPYFNGFYEASLPNPTYGKGCLLWASCTLSLLTLPVVIVATEEALAAVPNSLREGSYACGAGKWQTLQRIVLPYARPGIITGFILAMARGAGEVAPMMLVGAIPLATDLPLDTEFPFFHGSRSFMHLGFQIYSLGFQSQNSEAAKPMVFTATLLLLTIVTLLNVTAIWLRARLRKRFQSSQF